MIALTKAKQKATIFISIVTMMILSIQGYLWLGIIVVMLSFVVAFKYQKEIEKQERTIYFEKKTKEQIKAELEEEIMREELREEIKKEKADKENQLDPNQIPPI